MTEKRNEELRKLVLSRWLDELKEARSHSSELIMEEVWEDLDGDNMDEEDAIVDAELDAIIAFVKGRMPK